MDDLEVGRKGGERREDRTEWESEREKVFVWEMGHFPVVILRD